MLYKYVSYGVPIVSEIELPVLFADDTHLTGFPIVIRYNSVNLQLQNPPLKSNDYTWINDTEAAFVVPDVAKFYITNSHINVDPIGHNDRDIATYAATMCIAIALGQRGMLPFHVSGVFINPDSVVLFAAHSGTGKSTTVSGLNRIGYKLFTDDTCILEEEDGHIYATSSYPMVKLWEETLNEQSFFKEKERTEISNKEGKYGFGFHEDFVKDKVRVAGIVFLEKEGEEIEITNLNPLETLEFLSSHMFLNFLFYGSKMEILKLKLISEVANKVMGFRVMRPFDKPTFEALALRIQEAIIYPLRRNDKDV